MQVDLIRLFKEVAYECDLDPATVRYCVNRIVSEGHKFLTVTLPKLSKAVLRSLELGYFDRPTDFAWKGGALRYFRVILSGIFDLSTGRVLSNPDALSLLRLRQLCDYFYKLALPYSEEDLTDHTEKFLSVERQLSAPFDKDVVEQARKDFETYIPEVAYSEVHDVFTHATPRPGPGTFSGKADYGTKWYARKFFDDSIHEDMLAVSGYFRYLRSAPRPSVTGVDPEYSEVLFVPKDSRGPRVIVREPFCRLKAQMAFFDWISRKLESRFQIRFYDQQPNRLAALQSSIDRKYATVDLKEASDRVRLDVAHHLFRNSPAIRYFLTRCRSATVRLPDGRFHTLKKVAGMGSGLTFPIMALTIFLVSTRTIADHFRIPFLQAAKLVQVYGDDLIVPNTCLDMVVSRLTSVGLLVNQDKTFSRSHFRESCGGDYFRGQEVTPVRLKLGQCELRTDKRKLWIEGSQNLISIERHCRELVKAGLLRVAEYFYSCLRVHIPLPLVCQESPVLGRYVLNEELVRDQFRMDSTGEYVGVKACITSPKIDRKFSMDHYHVLGSKLKAKAPISWRDKFYAEGSNVTGVSVPRAVNYHWVKVNPLTLL